MVLFAFILPLNPQASCNRSTTFATNINSFLYRHKATIVAVGTRAISSGCWLDSDGAWSSQDEVALDLSTDVQFWIVC